MNAPNAPFRVTKIAGTVNIPALDFLITPVGLGLLAKTNDGVVLATSAQSDQVLASTRKSSFYSIGSLTSTGAAYQIGVNHLAELQSPPLEALSAAPLAFEYSNSDPTSTRLNSSLGYVVTKGKGTTDLLAFGLEGSGAGSVTADIVTSFSSTQYIPSLNAAPTVMLPIVMSPAFDSSSYITITQANNTASVPFNALDIANGLGVPTDTAAFTLTSSSGIVTKDNFTIDLFEIPDVSSAIQSPSALLAGQRGFVKRRSSGLFARFEALSH